MTATERARIARANTWTCPCGSTAVSIGAFPMAWVEVSQRGGPHRTAWLCSWPCALALVMERAA